MGYQNALSEYMPDPNTKSGQALITSSLWIQLGFVGACVVVIGFAMLFAGGAQPIVTSAGALAGGVFAAYAFRRAWLLLLLVDAEAANNAGDSAGFASNDSNPEKEATALPWLTSRGF